MSLLAKLPIIVETISLKKRKEQLERSLKEIEDAQKVFSKPKGLIELNFIDLKLIINNYYFYFIFAVFTQI